MKENNIYCDKCKRLMKKSENLRETYFCIYCNRFKRIEPQVEKQQEKIEDIAPLSDKIIKKIEEVIEIFQDYGIDYFNYLVKIQNLDSISKYGILSRNVIERLGLDFKDISKEIYQNFRKRNFNIFFRTEDVHDYAPLYISSHTTMIHPISSPFKQHYAILKLDPFLFYGLKEDDIKKIKISNASINQRYPHPEFKIINLFDDCDKLKMFLSWDLFNNNTHYADSWTNQKKSAEILIPRRIPFNYVIEICPKCSEKVYKRHINSFNLLDLANFNNREFEFIDEKIELYSFNFEEIDDLDLSEIEINFENESDKNDISPLNDDENNEDNDNWSKFEDL